MNFYTYVIACRFEIVEKNVDFISVRYLSKIKKRKHIVIKLIIKQMGHSHDTESERVIMTESTCHSNIKIVDVHIVNSHYFKLQTSNIRGRCSKYLASPPEGASIVREIYYRVVHSRSRLLSKFQSNRTRSFVLPACGNERVRGFYKNEERAILVGASTLVFRRDLAQRNQRVLGYCVR